MAESTSLLAGVSGEYYVAAELSRRGYIASITLRNTKGIDVLVSNQEVTKQVGIQVKTSRVSEDSWMLNKKAEEYYSETLFYIFVHLRGDVDRPNFYIVPSKVVADYIKQGHSNWLKTPGKKGQKHQDSPIRKFQDADKKYLENWQLLGLD